jgi:hypothetical protein
VAFQTAQNYCEYVKVNRTEGKLEVTGWRGRRSKQLLDYLKGMRGYCNFKEKTLDRTVLRTRLGRGYGPAV